MYYASCLIKCNLSNLNEHTKLITLFYKNAILILLKPLFSMF